MVNEPSTGGLSRRVASVRGPSVPCTLPFRVAARLRFENKKEISPGWTLQNTRIEQLARTSREPQDQHRVLCHEIWDLDSNRVRMICEGSERWQRVETNPYDGIIDGLPFYPITPSDGLFDWFGESPINMFLDQVIEISKIRTKQLDHIYRMPGKVLANRSSFTDEEIKQMRDPDEHFVTCTDPHQVKDFAALRPDPNMYIVEERAKGDIEHVSGFSELTLGKTPGSRTTATVGMIAARASSVRIKRVIDAVEEFVIWAGTDLSGLIAAFAPDEYQIQVMGDRGIEWLAVSRNDLKGEFFFEIDVTEMAPISRVASMPFSSGIAISISTMSGQSLATKFTACRPLAATPRTVISGSASSRKERPSRTTA